MAEPGSSLRAARVIWRCSSAAVESTLSALGSDSSLDELQAAREQIVRLNDLSPDSEILLRIRSTLTERLSEAVEQELKEQRREAAVGNIGQWGKP